MRTVTINDDKVFHGTAPPLTRHVPCAVQGKQPQRFTLYAAPRETNAVLDIAKVRTRRTGPHPQWAILKHQVADVVVFVVGTGSEKDEKMSTDEHTHTNEPGYDKAVYHLLPF